MNALRNILTAFLLLPLLLTAETDLNQLFGIKLFPRQPEQLWRESNAEIFARLQNRRNFKAGGNSALASFPLQKKTVLGIPAAELRIVRTPKGEIERIDIYFYNKGDSAKEHNMKMKIRRSGQNLNMQLTKTFGQSVKTTFGTASKKNGALKWETPQAIFVTEAVKGEFSVLHLLAPQTEKKAENSSQSAPPGVNLADNIQSNDFGDYWIANIPMVNQGNKGYCVPATIERILLYYGCTDLDMHRIADIAKTGRGGGTSISTLNNTLAPILRKKGITPVKTGELVFFNIKKHISSGIPILWCMYSSTVYEKMRIQNTLLRKRYSSPKKWKNMTKKIPKISASGSAHVCLIIGFNELTKEIAVSNSWGDRELLPSWIPLNLAKKVSMHQSWIYQPNSAKDRKKAAEH